MRAAIYLRISQDRSGEQAGVQRQQQDCEDLARQLEWQVVEVYIDNDLSASGAKPRPAYRRMLADIEAGRIDGVLAWHTDRLYRRPLDLEELIPIVERHRLLIRTCRAGEIDLSTATGQMLARILGATARHEVDQKTERWRRSVRQRREAGRFWGAGPRKFGYSGLHKGAVKPDGYDEPGLVVPDEADVIRRVADAVIEGRSLYAIAGQLEADGVRTTWGNAYRPETLKTTMLRPDIAGLSVLNGEIVGEGTWEPILDRTTWETVRAILMQPHRAPGGGPPALLSGLAFCGFENCGQRLYRHSHQRGKRYVCSTKAQRRARHVAIMAAPVEEMVEAFARERLSDERVVEAVRKRLAPGVPAEMLREISDYEDQLAELRESLTLTKRETTHADIVRAMDAIRDEIDDRRARISPAAAHIEVTGDEWPDDLERRSALVRLVVSRVVVLPTPNKGGGRDIARRVRIDPVRLVDQAEQPADARAEINDGPIVEPEA